MTNYFFSKAQARFGKSKDVFASLENGSLFTYGDLLEWSARYANALLKLGVKPGDRVAVQVEKNLHSLFLYLATLRAGAVYLPLNTAYTEVEIDYFVGDAEPKIVVCNPDVAAEYGARYGERVQSLGLTRLSDEAWGSIYDIAAGCPSTFADVSRQEGDLAAILYTSGTTGRSKGAMISHGNLVSNASALVEAWRFGNTDVLIHALPIFHIHGLFVATNVTLFSGSSMVFLTRFDPKRVIDLMKDATCLMGVPTFYVRLLKERGLDGAATRNMRLFISGSAPLLAETHRSFEKQTGHVILERYGMTETNMNTSNPYEGARIPGTVGQPLQGVDLRVVDPSTHAELSSGEAGMIEVRGPNVFKGYWRNPEKTKAEFTDDGYFITGDIGTLDTDGYVTIVGRGKDLIISGGFNIYPKEIEEEIDQLGGVVESAVIGCPHPDFGEGVTAVIVADGSAQLTEKDVISTLSSRLARFKLPKRIFFVGELPRNTMGKVQKNILRDTYKDIYTS